jgi:amino acid transporter
MPATQTAKEDAGLIRAIGVAGLTANIVNSTVGAGIFALPAAVALQLGAASPLAYVVCAIAMCLFVTSFAMAGSRVSLTGGLYAYVEVAFGQFVGFIAGFLYFLTAILAISGIVTLIAASVGGLVPILATPVGQTRATAHFHSGRLFLSQTRRVSLAWLAGRRRAWPKRTCAAVRFRWRGSGAGPQRRNKTARSHRS